MARLDDIELPPAINEVLVQALEVIPDRVLLEFAADWDGSWTKPRAVRQRLAQTLGGASRIPESLRIVLAGTAPGRAAIGALDADFIPRVEECLSAVVGRERLVLALLLDHREPVVSHGRRLLQEAPGPARDNAGSDSEVLRAVHEIMDVFRCTHEATVAPAEGEKTEKSDPDRAGRFEAELKSERKRWTQARDKLKEQLADADRQLKDVRVEVQDVRRELAKVHDDLNHERASRASLVGEAVRVFREDAQRKWLVEAEAIQAVTSESHNSDLLVQVETALARQAEIDRHAGNRRDLQARLEALTKAESQIDDTCRHALKPSRTLSQLREKVRVEREQIAALLGRPPHDQPLVAMLHQRVSDLAADGDGLLAIRELIRCLQAQRMVSAIEAQTVEQAILRRLQILHERTEAMATARLGLGGELHAQLANNPSVRVLIDGHNFALDDRLVPARERSESKSEQRSREALCESARVLARQYPMAEFDLYFDSSVADERSLGRNLRVRYSGGRGTDRADNEILKMLDFLDRKEPAAIKLVVTEDQELRQKAAGDRVRFVRNGELAALIAALARSVTARAGL